MNINLRANSHVNVPGYGGPMIPKFNLRFLFLFRATYPFEPHIVFCYPHPHLLLHAVFLKQQMRPFVSGSDHAARGSQSSVKEIKPWVVWQLLCQRCSPTIFINMAICNLCHISFGKLDAPTCGLCKIKARLASMEDSPTNDQTFLQKMVNSVMIYIAPLVYPLCIPPLYTPLVYSPCIPPLYTPLIHPPDVPLTRRCPRSDA